MTLWVQSLPSLPRILGSILSTARACEVLHNYAPSTCKMRGEVSEFQSHFLLHSKRGHTELHDTHLKNNYKKAWNNWECSAGEGTCHWAWQSELDTGTHMVGRKKNQFPVLSSDLVIDMYTQTYTYTQRNTKKNERNLNSEKNNRGKLWTHMYEKLNQWTGWFLWWLLC